MSMRVSTKIDKFRGKNDDFRGVLPTFFIDLKTVLEYNFLTNGIVLGYKSDRI